MLDTNDYSVCRFLVQIQELFPQNFPLAPIGTHDSFQPWALQLPLGCESVQTCYALCTKIYIFYFQSTLIIQNALASTSIPGTVFAFWVFSSGVQGVPMTICCCLIDILFHMYIHFIKSLWSFLVIFLFGKFSLVLFWHKSIISIFL